MIEEKVRNTDEIGISLTPYLVLDEFVPTMSSRCQHSFEACCAERADVAKAHLVGNAEYPAFRWFSFYALRRELASRGFRACDRFDTLAPGAARGKRAVAAVARSLPPARFLAHVLTPYTQVVAIRDAA